MRKLLCWSLTSWLVLSEAWTARPPSRLASSTQTNVEPPSSVARFPSKPPPYLALVTSRTACDDEATLLETLQTLKVVIGTDQVDLISVRVNPSDDPSVVDRVRRLIQQLVVWRAQASYCLVVSSDWADLGLEEGVDGVHCKETHRERIPQWRNRYPSAVMGSSCHSIASAEEAIQVYHVDYLFVGTCYYTASHPEKTELEGPQLPGQVRQHLLRKFGQAPPVLAIGGIDPEHVAEPMSHGADGVAVIRAIVEAKDPEAAVAELHRRMRE